MPFEVCGAEMRVGVSPTVSIIAITVAVVHVFSLSDALKGVLCQTEDVCPSDFPHLLFACSLKTTRAVKSLKWLSVWMSHASVSRGEQFSYDYERASLLNPNQVLRGPYPSQCMKTYLYM